MILTMQQKKLVAASAAFLAIAVLSGCQGNRTTTNGVSSDATTTITSPNANEPVAPGHTDPGGEPVVNSTVTLVTTNSFAISEDARTTFTAQTGYDLNVVQIGSAGILTNQLILTADHPLGDVFFGVDNTQTARVLAANIAEPFIPANLPPSAEPLTYGGALTPITSGDVCLNIDSAWFAERNLPEPTGFMSLIDPAFRGQSVVLNPLSSSPGMAFMLATIAYFGSTPNELGTAMDADNVIVLEDATTSGTPLAPDSSGILSPADYWVALFANDVLVADSWSVGYFTDFSGASEGGTRPIVVSYSSSPASTLNADGTASTTRALLNTCFRQIDYAGVLRGAANPSGAQALLEFLVGEQFQQDLPTQMWVYPIDTSVALPADWATFAPQADSPLSIPAEVVDAYRQHWLEQWQRLAQR
jgi:thiamine transport system substrate-binding protein